MFLPHPLRLETPLSAWPAGSSPASVMPDTPRRPGHTPLPVARYLFLPVVVAPQTRRAGRPLRSTASVAIPGAAPWDQHQGPSPLTLTRPAGCRSETPPLAERPPLVQSPVSPEDLPFPMSPIWF